MRKWYSGSMLVSSEEPAAYEHPRWFVRCAAIGFALLYAGGLAVANVFPCRLSIAEQEHGWPFVYMIRASRVPGGLTILYPMWPLGDPPLLQFRPTMLLLNCLCGILLVVIATIIPPYWLRVRQRPVQFSLRTLIVLTTVVACLLALLKCCYPDRVNVGIVVELAIFSLFSLVYYVVPACIVLTAAHWLVVRCARSRRRSRWFGLHWLTWLAACAVGGPFLHYLIVTINYYYEGYGLPSESYVEDFRLAWRFHWPTLVGGLAVWLTVLASTAFVVERWIRRVEQRVHLQKRVFLFLSLVVAIMIWISRDWSWEPDSCDYYAWLFGLAGTIYAIEVLTVRHWKSVPKFSLLAGILAGAPFWFALSPLQEPRLAAGLSLVAGAFAATVVDAGCRILMHRDKGPVRFIDAACGERVAVFPMWAVGIIGIGGGLLLLYS